LIPSDTPKWSEDDRGGSVVQLWRQDMSDSKARSMRDVLPFGLNVQKREHLNQ